MTLVTQIDDSSYQMRQKSEPDPDILEPEPERPIHTPFALQGCHLFSAQIIPPYNNFTPQKNLPLTVIQTVIPSLQRNMKFNALKYTK
jgi:hypothetical protein